MTPPVAPGSAPGALSLVPSLTLEVWSDLTCPWCYVGSRRLTLALAHESNGSVLVRWRSMDCPSALPVQQLGDALDIRAPHTHADVSDVGREVGIVFGEKGEPADPVDTSLAHRAVLLYDEDPRQRAVAAALFAAHFERGQSLADLSTVVSAVVMAAEDDPVSVRDRLVSGEGEDRLDADRMQAQLMGITTLPAYAVGGRTVLLGDQSTEQLRRLVAHDRVLQIA